jgi:hypothetical protein
MLLAVPFYAGLAIVCVALLFVRDPGRLRRLLIAAGALVVIALAVFGWLVWSTHPDRIR